MRTPDRRDRRRSPKPLTGRWKNLLRLRVATEPHHTASLAVAGHPDRATSRAELSDRGAATTTRFQTTLWPTVRSPRRYRASTRWHARGGIVYVLSARCT